MGNWLGPALNASITLKSLGPNKGILMPMYYCEFGILFDFIR